MPPKTSYISQKAGATLLHGPRTAKAIGRPFNTFVTISLWHLGFAPEDASRFFQQLRERHFLRWSFYTPRGMATSRNGPPTHAWVLEAPNGLVHVHWMVHIQPGQQEAFARALTGWVCRRAAQRMIADNVVQIKAVLNDEGLKLYLAKGLHPHLARAWRIKASDCGFVAGRRSGTSRNIGPAEWRPRKAAYKQARRRAA